MNQLNKIMNNNVSYCCLTIALLTIANITQTADKPLFCEFISFLRVKTLSFGSFVISQNLQLQQQIPSTSNIDSMSRKPIDNNKVLSYY